MALLVTIIGVNTDTTGKMLKYKGIQSVKVGKKTYKCSFNIAYTATACIKKTATVKCRPKTNKLTLKFPKIDADDATLDVTVFKNKIKTCKVASGSTMIPTIPAVTTPPPGPGLEERVEALETMISNLTNSLENSIASISSSIQNLKQFHELKETLECNGNGTLLSTAPGSDMVLCKDENRNTCEKDLEILCPVGWHLCSQKEFNNRNDDWNYNWKDSSDNGPGNTNTDRDGIPFGVIYCWKHGGATNFGINGDMLNVDVPANCWNHNGIWASRPGCEKWAEAEEGSDCNNKYASALCCSQTSTCGNGVVDGIEEECDDGNNNEMDDCLRSCTWKTPADHGLSPCRGDLG